jgi:hypothetical protein
MPLPAMVGLLPHPVARVPAGVEAGRTGAGRGCWHSEDARCPRAAQTHPAVLIADGLSFVLLSQVC